MTLRSFIFVFLWLPCSFAGAQGERDPGQDVIGELMVELIYASESADFAQGAEVAPARVAELREVEALDFAHYRQIGVDRKNVLRGYQNWAFPVKGSDRLMLSFQPLGEVQGASIRLDLELWMEKKKILKADPIVEREKPLYIRGPQWRGGHIILVVTLTRLT